MLYSPVREYVICNNVGDGGNDSEGDGDTAALTMFDDDETLVDGGKRIKCRQYRNLLYSPLREYVRCNIIDDNATDDSALDSSDDDDNA